MTFEKEWAEMRSAAARRSAMQINSAPVEGGGGAGAPTLLDSCAHISNHLDYTKAQHAKGDVKIGGDLTSVSKLSEYMK